MLPAVTMTRTIFPSRTLPLTCERYVLRNGSPNRTRTIYIPEYMQTFETDPAKGVEGSYVLRTDISGSGRFEVAPGDSVVFDAVFQAYRKGENPVRTSPRSWLRAVRSYGRTSGTALCSKRPIRC